jgi:hypothetical protein
MKPGVRLSRVRAALIHLTLSAVVAAMAAALVFLVWYPHPFEVLAGGVSLFLLITSVDVVMGPLLTFAVFDPRKAVATLRRDLLVIGLLQLAALGYGLHTIYAARPAVLALEGDRFRVVTVVDVVEKELPLAPPGLRELSVLGPRTVRTAKPSAEERDEALSMALAGNDLGTRPKFWRAWDDEARREVKAAALPLADLMKSHAAQRQQIERAAARTGVARERVKYLPVLSRFADGVMLVDGVSGEILDYAPFDAP